MERQPQDIEVISLVRYREGHPGECSRMSLVPLPTIFFVSICEKFRRRMADFPSKTRRDIYACFPSISIL